MLTRGTARLRDGANVDGKFRCERQRGREAFGEANGMPKRMLGGRASVDGYQDL
jgi:hypothetical protein